MNTAPPLLCLPCLHAGNIPQKFAPLKAENLFFLWPGLPAMPASGYWQPADYPFAPREAARCLEDIKAAGDAALTGASLAALMAQAASPETLKKNQEDKALAQFAASGEAAPADTLPALRRAAQIVLLHAWLLEEQQKELMTLNQAFEADALRFGATLGLEEDDAPAHDLAAVSAPLPESPALTPPWRLVLENAALFLPDNTPLLCLDAAMCDEVTDRLAPQPVPQELARALDLPQDAAPRDAITCVSAPLWQILGKSKAPAASPWLCKTVTILV